MLTWDASYGWGGHEKMLTPITEKHDQKAVANALLCGALLFRHAQNRRKSSRVDEAEDVLRRASRSARLRWQPDTPRTS